MASAIPIPVPEAATQRGTGYNHALITGNCFIELLSRLQPRGCRPLVGELRVRTPSGLEAYPDISVIRGEPELADRRTTLLNPVMIVEVLAAPTASFDRGDKFRHYRSIPSLSDYLLVDSQELSVEHFSRGDAGEWVLRAYSESDERVFLPKIDETLPLDVLYQGVELDFD